jgi:hypothetical protein
MNYVKKTPNTTAKYQVLALISTRHFRRDIGKNERVEGQESLHTADAPTD